MNFGFNSRLPYKEIITYKGPQSVIENKARNSEAESSCSESSESSSLSEESSISEEAPILPAAHELVRKLGVSNPDDVVQDCLNPYIFTVTTGKEKAYWFFNVITEDYQQLISYEKADSDQPKVNNRIDMGSGKCNNVYSRLDSDTIAVRRVYQYQGNGKVSEEEIKRSNLVLSLMYSMPNHLEILKSINVGFIKSSEQPGLGWKTITPLVQGATLVQMFGREYRNGGNGTFNSVYTNIDSKYEPMVAAAKQYHGADLENGKDLVGDLKSAYMDFCVHAAKRGHYIEHTDLTPYNVMYNSNEHCLTLIDGDAWKILPGYLYQNENLDASLEEIRQHH